MELFSDVDNKSPDSFSGSDSSSDLALLHILFYVLAGLYLLLCLFPIISVTRMIVLVSRKRREEKETLLPRDYTPAVSGLRRLWVAWFHIFLFIGAGTRVAYLAFEASIQWSHKVDNDPKYMITESVLMTVGTVSLFCCYIVILGKLLELFHIPPPNKTSSLSSINYSSQQSRQLKCSKSVKGAVIISIILMVIHLSLMGVQVYAIAVNSDPVMGMCGLINRWAVVGTYFLLSASYGFFVMRIVYVFNSDANSSGVPPFLWRIVALTSLLTICFCIRAVAMIILTPEWLREGHRQWVPAVYYAVTELLPQVLMIILFIRNQKAVKVNRKRRTNPFGSSNY